MIVNDASSINVIDNTSLALASVVNYDHKWRYNLERHTSGINYDSNKFIIQATDKLECLLLTGFFSLIKHLPTKVWATLISGVLLMCFIWYNPLPNLQT